MWKLQNAENFDQTLKFVLFHRNYCWLNFVHQNHEIGESKCDSLQNADTFDRPPMGAKVIQSLDTIKPSEYDSRPICGENSGTATTKVGEIFELCNDG